MTSMAPLYSNVVPETSETKSNENVRATGNSWKPETKRGRGRPRKDLNVIIKQIEDSEKEIDVAQKCLTYTAKRTQLKRLKQNLSACICRRKKHENEKGIQGVLNELEEENRLLNAMSAEYDKGIKKLIMKLKLNFWNATETFSEKH